MLYLFLLPLFTNVKRLFFVLDSGYCSPIGDLCDEPVAFFCRLKFYCAEEDDAPDSVA